MLFMWKSDFHFLVCNYKGQGKLKQLGNLVKLSSFLGWWNTEIQREKYKDRIRNKNVIDVDYYMTTTIT